VAHEVNRLWALAPLVALLMIAGVGALLLNRGADRAVHFEARVGRMAPALDLPALDGDGRVQASALAGRPYVVNLFASWCGPCRIEHPQLMALRGLGAPVIGVAYKDTPEATQSFLAEMGDPFDAVGLDPEGRFGLELGIVAVPETFVVGADGRIAAAYRGPLDETAVRDVIAPALRP
jgi:cytochrome c biogenesis protein CcmG/thiol:disulfide interchange protein DsbE